MNFKFVVLCALALMTGSAVYGQDNVIDEVVNLTVIPTV